MLRHSLVSCALVLLLGVNISAMERARSDPLWAAMATDHSTFAGQVTLSGFPQWSSENDTGDVTARVDGTRGVIPVVLWLSADESKTGAIHAASGAIALVRGTVVQLGAGSEAAFGVRAESFQVSGLAAHPFAHVNASLGQFAAGLRAQLVSVAAENPGAELVPGFAVGDTSLVGSELSQRMQESSLTHLTAVSGANCALVTGAITWCAAVCGARRRSRSVLAAGALCGFVVLVGPDASVQRAAVMAAVTLLSGFGGRRTVAVPALGAAITVLLLVNPWQALQPGFALSVAATGGILLLTPTLEHAMRRALFLPRFLALPIAVALSAQLACGPLLLLLQPGIPAVGVLANVIAAPAAPLGTGVGLIALLCTPWWPWLGEVCVVLASCAARWVAATAEVTAQLPYARWAWPGGWSGAILLVFVEVAALLGWLLVTRRLSLGRDEGVGVVPWRDRGQLAIPTRVAVALLIGSSSGVFLGPTLVGPLVARSGVPADWRVVACDVGQGDALLLRDPATPAQTMLVDTGDDREKLRACVERFGVERLALLVLTHDDRDHVGAAAEVLPTSDAVLIAPNNREDGEHRRVVEQLTASGVPVAVGAAGMSGGKAGLRWEVLAPAAAAVGGSMPADSNAASLVLRVTSGEVSVLLLADTGAAEQAALMRSTPELGATVVKVAHHGSRDEDPELPLAVRAEYGLVSVGESNRYGHPTRQALADYEAAGTRLLRTDTYGSIALSGKPGALRVNVERGPEPANDAGSTPSSFADSSVLASARFTFGVKQPATMRRLRSRCRECSVRRGQLRSAARARMSEVPSRLDSWQQHVARRARFPKWIGLRRGPPQSCW